METLGYVRVSTRDQNEERQIIAMEEAGVPRRAIYIDKQSGKDFERPAYQRMLRQLKDGDTLYIKSIDRFGRNYEEIIEQWRLLTQKGVGIVVLDMPILNTSKDRDLTGRLISDIVLQLLSYVAQTEREFIRQRQAEGIAAAQARGVHFGRKQMERPTDLEYYAKAWTKGKISSRKAAAIMGISHTTFLRWAKEHTEKGETA